MRTQYGERASRILNIESHSVFIPLVALFLQATGALAPSTSHSCSALFIPLHCPTNVLLPFLVIPALSFTLKDGFARVPFALIIYHLPFLFLTISSRVACFPTCSATIPCISTLGYAFCNRPATVSSVAIIVFKYEIRLSRSSLRVLH